MRILRIFPAALLAASLGSVAWAAPGKIRLKTPVSPPAQAGTAGAARLNQSLFSPNGAAGAISVKSGVLATVSPRVQDLAPAVSPSLAAAAGASAAVLPSASGAHDFVPLNREARPAIAPAADRTGEAPSVPQVGSERFQQGLQRISDGHESLKSGEKLGQSDGEASYEASASFENAKELKAGDAEAVGADQNGRGGSPLLGRADETGLLPLLGGLKEEGYSVLPAGSLMPEGAVERAKAHIQTRLGRYQDPGGSQDYLEVYDKATGRGWTDFAALPDGSAGFRDFIAAVDAALRKTLPDERFKFRDAQVRVVVNREPSAVDLHVDLGGHFTVTVSLDGPGTVLYTHEAGRLKARGSQPGEVVIITNAERELLTGILGTLHGAPAGRLDSRIVLILRFEPEVEIPRDQKRAASERARERAQSAQRLWESQRRAETAGRAPRRQAESGGLRAFLKKLGF